MQIEVDTSVLSPTYDVDSSKHGYPVIRLFGVTNESFTNSFPSFTEIYLDTSNLLIYLFSLKILRKAHLSRTSSL